MCEINSILRSRIHVLTAEDRDALREFARKRVAVAIDSEHVKFWQTVVEACAHPKSDGTVTGEES
jgi:hypothetical protein